jgi:hypothetical protein
VSLGQINFGPLRKEASLDAIMVRALEAKIADLISERRVLRRALQGCAALTPAAAQEKREALLITDPEINPCKTVDICGHS